VVVMEGADARRLIIVVPPFGGSKGGGTINGSLRRRIDFSGLEDLVLLGDDLLLLLLTGVGMVAAG